jgi:ssRNA-specific RNase YbeY (16S rRNA maturation enzyme)
MQNNIQTNFPNLEIYNEVTRKKLPIKNWYFLYEKFEAIKNEILGKNFQLTISLLMPANAKKVNQKMRKKTYFPNTLSFKYSKNSGEIILTPEIVQKENYEIIDLNTKKVIVIKKLENKIIYLFIHSSLHLTDLDHGDKMDRLEGKFTKRFVV